MASGDFDWTDKAIANLRRLWALGVTTAQIAKTIGVSKSAAVGKAHRLGLPGRPSPINRNVDGAPKVNVPKPVRRPKVTLVPVLTVACEAVGPPAARVKVEELPRPRSMRKSEPCCWPIGETRTPKFRYCDEPSVPGFPYCPQHHAKGVVSRRPALQVHGIGAIP